MTIDLKKLASLVIPPVRQTYGWRDTALYALGLGFGLDPMDERQLRFVDETKLVAIPTMCTLLGNPGFWVRDLDTGIDWVKVVHGEQAMTLHAPLPTEGEVIGINRVIDVVDKGVGKGALLYIERELTNAANGARLATLLQTIFCRGDGGFGGKTETLRRPHSLPERRPDLTIDLPTHPQMALVYRLSGDLNPLHSDPSTARKAGFERPILHGLATYGVVSHGVFALLCDYQPERLRSMDARFTAPVYPGEIISVDVWQEAPGRAAFQARVAARGIVVLSNGFCEFDG